MDYGSVHAAGGDIWALVERQHGVVSHRQLLGLGLSDPEQIRAAAARAPRLPGSAIVRRRLDLRRRLR